MNAKDAYTKACSTCGNLQKYSFSSTFYLAVKEDWPCKKCSYDKKFKLKMEKCIPIFLDLYNKGFGDRVISNDLKIHRNTIIQIRKYLNLNPNNPPRIKADVIDNKYIRCSRCKEIKDISKYQFGRKNTKQWYKF